MSNPINLTDAPADENVIAASEFQENGNAPFSLPTDEEDEVVPFKYTITSYGADYTVDKLVDRIRKGDIFVPNFQRGYVWTLKQASRFVESLLMGLPVPGIMLSREAETNKMLVIDGQQRLRSLEYFYKGIFEPTGQRFALIGVQKQFEGLRWETLSEQERRQLDDSILHATIVRQETPEEDHSSVYYVFERINTGGTPLDPQEVRAAIYHGPLCELLVSLNKNEDWRAIYGPPHRRMRDQELLLRFFALFYNSQNYAAPMKDFLNLYMWTNRDLKHQSEDELTALFGETIATVNTCLGRQALRRRTALNAAVFDAVMVGLARRLQKGAVDCGALKVAFESLTDDENFVRTTSQSTARIENVEERLATATAAFANLP